MQPDVIASATEQQLLSDPAFCDYLRLRHHWRGKTFTVQELRLLRSGYEMELAKPPTIKADGSQEFRIRSEGVAVITGAKDEATNGGMATFEGNAYTGAPMKPEGFWQPVIVDLDGIKIPSQHRPALRQHDHEQIVGHSTSVKADKDGIHVKGNFSGQAEHVEKVTVPAKNGFQWQLSIGANPIRTERLESGEETTVNGRRVTGPMLISRETEIGEISFVPLGADGATSATVAATKGKNMDPFKLALKDVMAELKAAGKSCTYSDADIDAMDAATAKAALKKQMKAADDEPDDKKKTDAAATLATLQAQAGDVMKSLRADAAKEHVRQSAITAACKEHGVVECEVDVKGAKTKVNLAAHAIENEWTAEQTELAAIKAARPGSGIGVPGGLSYAVNSPEITDAVLECAVLEETRCKLMSKSFFGAGKFGERDWMHPEDAERVQKEIAARYPDQVQQAAHTLFKGRIGLQRLLTIAAAAGGYKGREVIRDTGTLGEVAAACMRIHADGSSTINIANVTANVQNKFLLQGYMYTEQAWREIANIRPVNDFKPTKSINLFGDIEFKALGESQELANATLQDQAFANQATTSGRIITLPRTSIINDDIGALSTVPMILGRGGGLRLNRLFWTAFMSTTSKDDGGSTAFWAATHTIPNQSGNSNLVASGAGSALSSAGLTAAVLLFDNQVDPQGNPLGLDAEIVVYPSDLETTAWELLNSEFIVYGGSTASKQPSRNKFANRFKPVKSKYLNNSAFAGYSTTAWYLLGPPGVIPVIEVAALGGVVMPTVQAAGPDFQFNILGMTTRAFFDVDVNMQNFRGGVKSPGA